MPVLRQARHPQGAAVHAGPPTAARLLRGARHPIQESGKIVAVDCTPCRSQIVSGVLSSTTPVTASDGKPGEAKYTLADGVAEKTKAASAELLEVNPLYPGLVLHSDLADEGTGAPGTPTDTFRTPGVGFGTNSERLRTYNVCSSPWDVPNASVLGWLRPSATVARVATDPSGPRAAACSPCWRPRTPNRGRPPPCRRRRGSRR